MSHVLVLQHSRYETLGAIAHVLSAAHINVHYVRVFQGGRVPPSMGDAAGLIALGGSMSAYEQSRYPFLLNEIHLIERALIEGKPVLGICLGSQLLATALGATVSRGPRMEIGWFPVTLTPEGASDPLWTGVEHPFVAFHWHGDVLKLPQGAVSLASSDLTEHQAFRYHDNAYGILFHMEVTDRIIQDMVAAFPNELQAAGANGHEIGVYAHNHLPPLHKVGEHVFRGWARLTEPHLR